MVFSTWESNIIIVRANFFYILFFHFHIYLFIIAFEELWCWVLSVSVSDSDFRSAMVLHGEDPVSRVRRSI